VTVRITVLMTHDVLDPFRGQHDCAGQGWRVKKASASITFRERLAVQFEGTRRSLPPARPAASGAVKITMPAIHRTTHARDGFARRLWSTH